MVVRSSWSIREPVEVVVDMLDSLLDVECCSLLQMLVWRPKLRNNRWV
jgi:hypothetical protein